jgi:hypothetical protein
MQRLGVLLTFLAFVSNAANVHAASREARDRAAKRACLNGEPNKGVQILTDLFIDTKDPTYIYNQGRCYEQNSRYEEAIGRFREYIRKVSGTTDADKADIASAEKHIADCENLLGKQGQPPLASGPGTPGPQQQPYPVAPTGQQPYPGALPPQQPYPASAQPQYPGSAYPLGPAGQQPLTSSQANTKSSPGAALRIAGITTMAVGAAGLVTGLVLNLKANSVVNDLQNHYSDSNLSSSKDYKTGSQICYGIGAGFVVGGAILYVLGLRSGSQVTMVPHITASSAGAVLQGAF